MKRVLFLLALSTLATSFQCFSQSYLLDKGQNGSFINAFLENSYNYSNKGLSIGYTFNGRLDLMLLGEYFKGKGRASFFLISPGLRYMVIKQGRMPFSFSIMSEYRIKKFTQTDAIKDNTLRSGVSLYHRWPLSPKIALVPAISGTIDFAKRSLDIYKEKERSWSVNRQRKVDNFE